MRFPGSCFPCECTSPKQQFTTDHVVFKPVNDLHPESGEKIPVTIGELCYGFYLLLCMCIASTVTPPMKWTRAKQRYLFHWLANTTAKSLLIWQHSTIFLSWKSFYRSPSSHFHAHLFGWDIPALMRRRPICPQEGWFHVKTLPTTSIGVKDTLSSSERISMESEAELENEVLIFSLNTRSFVSAMFVFKISAVSN